MDYSRLTLLIINIDTALLIFCVLLSIMIFSSAWLQEKLLIKRILQLIMVKKDLRSLASEGATAIRRVCPVIIEKTSPEDFLELTRSKASFMPTEFAEDLNKCFAVSGKIKGLEKKSMSARTPKWQKIQALTALGYAQDTQAIDILKNALLSKDSDISYYAMLSLAQLKTNAAARVLLDHGAQKPQDGRKIASYLEKFPATVIDELIRATYADNDSVRFWAVRIMTKLKNDKGFERVVVLSKDPNPDVRASSCECLGELGIPESEKALAERLNDSIWFVRLHAVRAICKVCKNKALNYLAPLAKDPHWVIREAVQKCLYPESS